MAITITDLDGLQAINDDLSNDYVLGNDIDASATQGADWGEGGGVGFKPIGTSATPFIGTLDGGGFVISGLYINRPSTTYVGLFGVIDSAAGVSVTNLGVESGDITGYYEVGGFAGHIENGSRVSDCYFHGSVKGQKSASSTRLGGFVGDMLTGTITDCHSTGSVVGQGGTVGGFAGRGETNAGFRDCYSTSSVSGKHANVGGFVGDHYNGGTYRDCYATGNVSNTYTYSTTGGFAGKAQGIIDFICCYANGNVSAKDYVGGFISSVSALSGGTEPTFANCYATGNVSGTSAGGFAYGIYNAYGCYSTGNVTTSGYYTSAGGFADSVRGTVVNCYATGAVTVVSSGGTGQAGGFAREMTASGECINCYATGAVSGAEKTGGFVGNATAGATATDCYTISDLACTDASDYGPFRGDTNVTLTDCFWNTGSTIKAGGVDQTGATGISDANMKKEASFAAWDIDSTITPEQDTGTATSGGNTTLTDTGKAWAVNGYANNFVYISDGTGEWQIRCIVSNTSDTLTVFGRWETNPDATSEYSIIHPWIIYEDITYPYFFSPPSMADLAAEFPAPTLEMVAGAKFDADFPSLELLGTLRSSRIDIFESTIQLESPEIVIVSTPASTVDIDATFPLLEMEAVAGGKFAGEFPSLEFEGTATVKTRVAFAAEFPMPTFDARAGAKFAGEFPSLEFAGIAIKTATAAFAATFPSLEMSATAHQSLLAYFEATFPSLSMDATALQGSVATFAATFPSLEMSAEAWHELTANLAADFPAPIMAIIAQQAGRFDPTADLEPTYVLQYSRDRSGCNE